jgi:hypothetical protein
MNEIARIDPPFEFQHYFNALGSAVGARGTVVFHRTRFTALRHEGSALFAMHWLEASADRSIPLCVDWDRFEAIEDNNQELCIAVRWGECLVGYAVYLIHPHLHYAGLIVAEADAFFLREEDRSGFVGIKLFQLAERLLRDRGVQEVHQRVKLHVRPGRGRSDVGPVFAFLGYRPVETVWRKRIG